MFNLCTIANEDSENHSKNDYIFQIIRTEC